MLKSINIYSVLQLIMSLKIKIYYLLNKMRKKMALVFNIKIINYLLL